MHETESKHWPAGLTSITPTKTGTPHLLQPLGNRSRLLGLAEPHRHIILRSPVLPILARAPALAPDPALVHREAEHLSRTPCCLHNQVERITHQARRPEHPTSVPCNIAHRRDVLMHDPTMSRVHRRVASAAAAGPCGTCWSYIVVAWEGERVTRRRCSGCSPLVAGGCSPKAMSQGNAKPLHRW